MLPSSEEGAKGRLVEEHDALVEGTSGVSARIELLVKFHATW